MGSKAENTTSNLDQPLVNAVVETVNTGETPEGSAEDQTPTPPEKERVILVKWREVAVAAAAAAGVFAVFGYLIPPTMESVNETPGTAPPPVTGPPAPARPIHNSQSFPIAPEASYSPSFGGYTCASDSQTVKSGETIYGLTTRGLSGNPTFARYVYQWNLGYLREQSIDNSNNLLAGERVKILDDCISYGPIEKYGFYSSVTGTATSSISGRELEYQSYKDSDDKTHPNTTVIYATSNSGEFDKVVQCDPSPDCYTYVNGAPARPPFGTYISN